MLNRRILRIKVFQALYEYEQTKPDTYNVAEKNLMFTLKKMHELFVLNLTLFFKLSDHERKREEIQSQKLIQKTKLTRQRYLNENKFLVLLSENKDYNRLKELYKINWADAEDILNKLYRKIENSAQYIEYIESPETSLESDIEFLLVLYKKYLYNDQLLFSFLEEQFLHWVQDQFYISLNIINFLKKEAPSFNKNSLLPGIFKSVETDVDEDDELFVKQLFRFTIEKSEQYEPVIFKHFENWEPDRVALADIIILKMAVTEILNFPQIPVKSSLNEYIELAKTYSTPKSKIFVNGVLDKVVSFYSRNDEIHKIGRGLKENS